MQTSTQAVRARTDEPFLERFIQAHEAFVLRCASRHAGFAVTRSDDEYSVALLAFYESIKGYDPESGPFGAYASLVIGRRLADHYRSQHRFDAETPLAPQTFDGTVDRESADAAGPWMLCGSLCTTADVLVREAQLPPLRVGDVIAFGRCGAYSVTEGVAVFLSRDMPRVALCRGGDFTLVRDRFATDVLNTCRTPEDEA